MLELVKFEIWFNQTEKNTKTGNDYSQKVQSRNFYKYFYGEFAMAVKDNRIIWKEKSNLFLLNTIENFLTKYEIKTVRQYQKELGDHPKEAPSLWFINDTFGSWDKLQLELGKKPYDRYRWDRLPDQELFNLVEDFIVENNIKSYRQYEKLKVNSDLPSISTLKKRFLNLDIFFKAKREKENARSDFELLSALRDEIIRLKLESSLSRTAFEKSFNRNNVPAPQVLMRRMNKTWEQLLKEIGFDYREVKLDKLSKNLKNQN